jgi:hypothetical protein
MAKLAGAMAKNSLAIFLSAKRVYYSAILGP